MLLLFLLLGALAVAIAVSAFLLAMQRAEQRARRAMFTAMGLNPELTEALLLQRGSASAQISLVRQTSAAGGARPEEARTASELPPLAPQRPFRFTRVLGDARVQRERLMQPQPRRQDRQDRREPS